MTTEWNIEPVIHGHIPWCGCKACTAHREALTQAISHQDHDPAFPCFGCEACDTGRPAASLTAAEVETLRRQLTEATAQPAKTLVPGNVAPGVPLGKSRILLRQESPGVWRPDPVNGTHWLAPVFRQGEVSGWTLTGRRIAPGGTIAPAGTGAVGIRECVPASGQPAIPPDEPVPLSGQLGFTAQELAEQVPDLLPGTCSNCRTGPVMTGKTVCWYCADLEPARRIPAAPAASCDHGGKDLLSVASGRCQDCGTTGQKTAHAKPARAARNQPARQAGARLTRDLILLALMPGVVLLLAMTAPSIHLIPFLAMLFLILAVIRRLPR
jgi:hypothetical protein